MLTIYLNSLYHLLIEENIFVMIWQQIYRNVRALWNYRRNMAYVSYKHQHMVEQYQMIEAYIDHSDRNTRHAKFDVTR